MARAPRHATFWFRKSRNIHPKENDHGNDSAVGDTVRSGHMGWLSDIGNGLASAAGAIGDAVEDVANAVADAGHDAIDAIQDRADSVLRFLNDGMCEYGGWMGCRIGNIVFGGLSGLVRGVHDILDSFFDTIGHLGNFVGALLRGDLGGALGALINVVLDLVNLILAVGRVYFIVPAIYRGIRDYWNAESLRQFVEELLTTTFGADAEKLARIRAHLQMDEGSDWGLRVAAEHRTFCLDSAQLPLFQWHNEGKIDLYSLGGVANTSFEVWRRRTTIHAMSEDGVESSLRANRWQIAKYIEDEGKGRRLRVYALSRKAVKESIRASEEKGRQIGLVLQWNEGTRWDQFDFSRQVHEVSKTDELDPPYGFHFNRSSLDAFVIEKGYRGGTPDEECKVVASRCSTSAAVDAELRWAAISGKALERRPAPPSLIATTTAASRSTRRWARRDPAFSIAMRTLQ